MKKAISLLDEYESGIGLPAHQPPGSEDELNDFFSWDRTVIETMQPETCAMVAYRLAQYSFYFQREINRETARQKWAKSEMDTAIAKELGNYDQYTKYEAKVAMICSGNRYAEMLRSIQSKADQRITRLTYLSSSIKNLSDAMTSVGRAKAAKKYE